MPEIVNCQRVQAWHDARKGRITASVAAACLGLDKHKSRMKAWREIVLGEKEDPNRHMQRGVLFEPEARSTFEADLGVFVTECGFFTHPLLDFIGCSPDGLVGDTEGLECKCPMEAEPTGGKIPIPHLIQCKIALACTERERWHYYRFGADKKCWHRIVDRSGIPGLLHRLKQFHDRYILTHICPERKTPRRRKK